MKTETIVKRNPTASLDELVGLCGNKVSREYIRKLRVKLGLPPYKVTSQNRPLSTEEQVAKDLAVRTLVEKKKSTEGKNKFLMEKIEMLSAQLEASKVLQDSTAHTIRSSGKDKTEATAVVLCSDFHSEEEVTFEDTNGINEFNLKEFSKRSDTFFVSTAKLIAVKQKSIKVNRLVLALLGDFITGNIHEENAETAQLTPMKALLNAQNHLQAGIQYLLDNTNVDLVIPCHSGNHARITKKIRHATEAGNSLEYVMYHQLANLFKDEKRIKFAIAPGYLSYLDIDGFVMRLHHGHAIKFAGGIGGISISANKKIAQWDKTRQANIDCFGHFHQFEVGRGRKFICNGSLIGYNAYAVSGGFEPEKPLQAFFLVNHQRKEITDISPVWLS
jgi:hypothetical protein